MSNNAAVKPKNYPYNANLIQRRIRRNVFKPQLNIFNFRVLSFTDPTLDPYQVTVHNGRVSCDCPHFQYRLADGVDLKTGELQPCHIDCVAGQCKHVKRALRYLHRAGFYTHDLKRTIKE